MILCKKSNIQHDGSMVRGQFPLLKASLVQSYILRMLFLWSSVHSNTTHYRKLR